MKWILNNIFQARLHGLRVKKKDGQSIFLTIDADTSKQSIAHFLSSLDKKYQITFYDNSFPQISDPGGYVWAQGLTEESYAYCVHNHGWGSEWKEISKADLIEYIHSNRHFNEDNFKVYPYQKKAELGKTIGEY